MKGFMGGIKEMLNAVLTGLSADMISVAGHAVVSAASALTGTILTGAPFHLHVGKVTPMGVVAVQVSIVIPALLILKISVITVDLDHLLMEIDIHETVLLWIRLKSRRL